MFEKNKGNTPYYFCFAAGLYMAYIIYRMFDRLEGPAEVKHWILAVVLGLIALAMIGYGGYYVFFRKPKPTQELVESTQEGEE